MLCRELPPPRCSPQRHRLLARDTDATRDSTRHPDTVDGPRFFPRPAGLTAASTRRDSIGPPFDFGARPPRKSERSISFRKITGLGARVRFQRSIASESICSLIFRHRLALTRRVVVRAAVERRGEREARGSRQRERARETERTATDRLCDTFWRRTTRTGSAMMTPDRRGAIKKSSRFLNSVDS